MTPKLEQGIFAAGCFWKPQYIFSQVAGVKRTRVGYIGGQVDNPSYEQVCTDKTGHAEAVLVEFDPSEISYEQLVELFFANHDPTTLNRQGPDIGTQYRSGIFCTTPEQTIIATSVLQRLTNEKRFRGPIVTKIEDAPTFYDAEEYHQDYIVKTGRVCH